MSSCSLNTAPATFQNLIGNAIKYRRRETATVTLAENTLDLYEGFAKKTVDAVKANPELWKDTAIFITFDGGGGYYD